MSTQPVTAQHNSALFDLLWAGVTFLFLYIQVEYSCLCSPLEVKAFKLVPDFQSSFGLNLSSQRQKHQECVSLSRRALRLKNQIVVYCSREQKALIPQCHKYLCYDKSLWLLPSLCGGRVKTTPVLSRLSFLRFLSYASKCTDRSSGWISSARVKHFTIKTRENVRGCRECKSTLTLSFCWPVCIFARPSKGSLFSFVSVQKCWQMHISLQQTIDSVGPTDELNFSRKWRLQHNKVKSLCLSQVGFEHHYDQNSCGGGDDVK